MEELWRAVDVEVNTVVQEQARQAHYFAVEIPKQWAANHPKWRALVKRWLEGEGVSLLGSGRFRFPFRCPDCASEITLDYVANDIALSINVSDGDLTDEEWLRHRKAEVLNPRYERLLTCPNAQCGHNFGYLRWATK